MAAKQPEFASLKYFTMLLPIKNIGVCSTLMLSGFSGTRENIESNFHVTFLIERKRGIIVPGMTFLCVVSYQGQDGAHKFFESLPKTNEEAMKTDLQLYLASQCSIPRTKGKNYIVTLAS